MTPRNAIIAGVPELGDAAFERADDILAALSAAGYAVVPKEPTEAMANAGDHAMYLWEGDGDEGLHQTAAKFMWAAMLAAAPK